MDNMMYEPLDGNETGSYLSTRDDCRDQEKTNRRQGSD